MDLRSSIDEANLVAERFERADMMKTKTTITTTTKEQHKLRHDELYADCQITKLSKQAKDNKSNKTTRQKSSGQLEFESTSGQLIVGNGGALANATKIPKDELPSIR